MTIYDSLLHTLRKFPPQTIVFPEGDDPRVRQAAADLVQEGVVIPLLLTSKSLEQVKSLDPDTFTGRQEMMAQCAQLLQINRQEADKKLRQVTYFATMLVKMGLADGMVSGAAHSTADTVRPALKLIKAQAGMKRVSGAFIMERGKQRYVFADCAMNIDPDSATLVEIAYQSAQTAKMVGLEPKIAFLSFSTKGSAAGKMVDKVAEASRVFQQKYPQIPADGELQFDAAFVPEVAARKAPDSQVAGQANVFIFPEIQSGNIAYKITQRLGGFSAVGPILQGMARPINDLSRGASSQDIYQAAIVTAAQAVQEQNK